MKTKLLIASLLIAATTFGQNLYKQDSNSQIKLSNTPSMAMAIGKDTLIIQSAKVLVVDSFKLTVDSLKRLLKKKPDTVAIPVYLVEAHDTFPVNFIYGQENLKRMSGYADAAGFKRLLPNGTVSPDTWETAPVIKLIFDKKMRPLNVKDVVENTVKIDIEEMRKAGRLKREESVNPVDKPKQ